MSALKGYRVHECDLCARVFTRAEHLRRHRRRAHGGQGQLALEVARTGNVNRIKALLEKGYLPEDVLRDEKGRTPLFLAAMNGHDKACEEFLKHDDKDINNTDVEGQSPLIVATKSGHVLTVRVLLGNSRILAHLKDLQGRDALSYAAEGSFLDIVELLLGHQVDVNSRDLKYRTPLSWAMSSGNTAVIKSLVAAGAMQDDVDIFTDSGYASNVTAAAAVHPSDDIDDACTVYSFESVANSEKISYELAFARELLKTLQTNGLNPGYFKGSTSTLIDLLQAFALNIGRDARQQKDYDAMFFTLKYRSEIINTLQDQWGHNERAIARSQSNAMHSDERVRRWQASLALEPPVALEEEIEDLTIRETEDFGVTSGESVIIDYNNRVNLSQETQPVNLDFVTASPAYAWLVRKLINQSRLSTPVIDNIINIQASINRHFKPNKISRQTPRLLHVMVLHLEWNLLNFLQGYHFEGIGDYATILRTYITLTSDGNHVQALTALQYLQQTTPEFGENLLDLVINIANHGQASASFYGVTIEGGIVNSMVCFDIGGNVNAIVEICQQLVWMGSVFRPGLIRGIVYECLASMTDLGCHTTTFEHGILNTNTAKVSKSWSCTIKYELNEATTKTLPGNCWHNLFEYGVIARGFPITRREHTNQGLEMNLGAMLALCHAQHIVEHNGNIIIKGFSSMLSLSKRESGVSVWHFSSLAKGKYISYSEAAGCVDLLKVGAHEVLQDRHMVGWCSESTYGIGAINGRYEIQESCLLHALAGHYLFGRKVRPGLRTTPQAICIADSRAAPRPTTLQNFHERLKRLHTRTVVLWDVEKQRGWLTNGSSALLHLVLTSVESGNGDDPFTASYCLRKTDIKQRGAHMNNAAAWILLDEHNLKLPILEHGSQTTNLRERIEDLCLILELIIEHQITALADDNTSIPNALEGWDFMDISNTARDPLYPRFLVPEKDCSGWMTLLKDTNAITLFGNNFGELLTPTVTQTCPRWKTLPTKQFYLAASISDLESITKAYNGDSRIVPRRLTHGTVWPLLEKTFKRCGCSGISGHHQDRIQVLVPTSILTTKPDLSGIISEAPPQGAAIFGGLDPTWCSPSRHGQSPSISRKRTRSVSESESRDSALGDSISSVQTPIELVTPTHKDYFVAVVCALSKELRAVRHLFDEKYPDPPFDRNDESTYIFGSLVSHKIVAVCLPGIYTCSAAVIAAELKRSFPNVRVCLLVGIAGGIPSSKNDIRLGDIVVSRPSGNHSGTIKYDFEKVMQNGESQLLGNFNQPPRSLLSIVATLEASPPDELEPMHKYLTAIGEKCPEYRYPGTDKDILYTASHSHEANSLPCSTCAGHVVERKPRSSPQPRIHYGLIASGDKLVRDAATRDRIGRVHGALCFEMEGAGISNIIPSLIIRGISDYSDSHKNDDWQEYAAAVAATFAKLVLGKLRPWPDS